jgi:hypothetical protein
MQRNQLTTCLWSNHSAPPARPSSPESRTNVSARSEPAKQSIPRT